MSGAGEDIAKLIPHLRRFSRALVRDHSIRIADDLVQETVVLAMKPDRRDDRDVLTRCFATLIEVHRVRCREVAVVRQVGGWSEEARADAPTRPDGVRGSGSWGPAHFEALPVECREVLLLSALAGLDCVATADILGVTPDVALARLTDARDRLVRLEQHADPAKAGQPEASPTGRGARRPSHLRVVK